MSTRTFMSRLVVGLLSFAGVVAPLDAVAQSNGSSIQDRTIPTYKLDGKLTREQMDTQVSRGLKLTGGRYILWSTGNARWEYSDGSATPVWSALSSGTGTTLETAHSAGPTITISGSDSPMAIVDAKATSTGALAVSSTTAVTGTTVKSFMSVTDAASNNTSGAVTGVKVDMSSATNTGGGTLYGLYANMNGASDYGLYVANGAAYVDDALTVGGALTVTGAFTIGAVTASGASHSFTSSATTGNAFLITADSVTTGKVLRLVSSSTGFDQAGGGRMISVYNGSTQTFDVGNDGATHIVGTNAATSLLVDDGNVVVTSGDVTMTDGAFTVTAGDATLSSGKLTVTPSATSAKGVVIVGGSGARSVSALEYISSGAFTQPQLVWTGSGAFSGNFEQSTISGAASGNFHDTDVGAVAYTGNVYDVSLGSTCTTCKAALFAGGAAARTTPVVSLTDASTGTAADTLALSSANTSATGAEIRVTEAASFAGTGIVVATDSAAVGAGGIGVTSATRAYTTPLVNITGGASNNTVPSVLVTTSATGAATTANHGYSFVSSAAGFLGAGFKATLAQSTAASVLIGTTTGGSRTSNLIDLTDAGVGAGHGVSVTASGIGSGHLYYGTFSAAGTGNGLNIAMGSNVAGGGVVVSSAATTGYGLAITHTGAFASAAAKRSVAYITSSGAWDADTTNGTFVLDVDQNTAAGAVGDYALHVSATGTNVEGLWVDNGTSKFDETVTVGVSGTGAGAATSLTVYPAPGQIGVTIDGTTSGNRPTQTSGVLYVPVTTATASTRSVKVSTTTTGDQDAVAGVESVFASGGLTTSTKTNAAFKATYTGNATDVGYYADFQGHSTASYGVTSAFVHSGAHSYTLSTYDQTLKIQPLTTSSGNGKETDLLGGAANTSGTGGLVQITGGAGATAGAGGAVQIWSGTGAGAGADGVIDLGIAGGTDKVRLSEAATAAGFGGINTVSAAGSMRPTRAHHVPVTVMYPITGAAAATYEGGPARTFVDATANQAAFFIPITSEIDGTADIVVAVAWTAAAGAGGPIAMRCNYKNVSDNGDQQTAFTNTTPANDTLTGNDDQERFDVCTIPNAGFADGDLLLVRIERLPADASDTLGQDVSLLDATYRYTSLTP